MKIVYDSDKDILQISFKQTLVEETTQIATGLILDYDEDGKVIGLELRNASKKVDNPYEILYLIDKANDDKPFAKVNE
ncbi:MAG: DUF2283 domain-containing protein [Cyanobacteria bacterium J06621_11]